MKGKKESNDELRKRLDNLQAIFVTAARSTPHVFVGPTEFAKNYDAICELCNLSEDMMFHIKEEAVETKVYDSCAEKMVELSKETEQHRFRQSAIERPGVCICGRYAPDPRHIGATKVYAERVSDYMIETCEYSISDVNLPFLESEKNVFNVEPPKRMFDDAVVHPNHYNTGKIETWDYILDHDLDFLIGNAVKYLSRAGKKDPEKELQDLKKAVFFIEKKISVLEEDGQENDEEAPAAVEVKLVSFDRSKMDRDYALCSLDGGAIVKRHFELLKHVATYHPGYSGYRLN